MFFPEITVNSSKLKLEFGLGLGQKNELICSV